MTTAWFCAVFCIGLQSIAIIIIFGISFTGILLECARLFTAELDSYSPLRQLAMAWLISVLVYIVAATIV